LILPSSSASCTLALMHHPISIIRLTVSSGSKAFSLLKRCTHQTTKTTIGRLNGFESHVRRYFTLGKHDSVEAAVYSYDNDSGPFSKRGDSGSIIVDALGKFVALLTGGTGLTDSSDITFGSPMYWLWEIIKVEFPGACLYFEDDDN